MIHACRNRKSSEKPGWNFQPLQARHGFTLLELVVAMAVSAIVLLGIYASHALQQDTLRNQTMVVDTQQNLRGALTLMQQDLLMAGYNPQETDEDWGVQWIGRRNGNAWIRFSGDFGVGTFADNGTLDSTAGSEETISYYLFDSTDTDAPGNIDLCREVDGAQNLMAPGIEALEMAFAYDNDGDGELETYNGEVIWAIDSDGDLDLDHTLDDNGDGRIDAADTPGGVSLTGLGLADDIPLENIRAIKIWLLARTESLVRSRNYIDSQTYVIGGRRLTPNDKYQRRLLTSTIRLRNIGI